MKRVLTIMSSIFFLMSCGNSSDSKEKSAPGENAPKTEVRDPAADKGLVLITKSDCFTCHKLKESSIGPAYALIAAKYKTLDGPAMDSIVKQIIKGGKGKWGEVQMPEHANIPKEDAELMAHYIMAVKK